jgi:nitrite reductase/ring-hydroxylating ferredoxin subunit
MTTTGDCPSRPADPTTTLRRSTDRRGAIQRLCAGILGLLSGARLLPAQKKMALSLDKAEKLKTTGGSVVLKIQGRDLLFIRDSEQSVRVLDPTCSHKKCTVEYSKDKQRIVCPCHSSNYTLDGKVLNGPAEKPLQVFEATLDAQNNRIIFSAE